MLDRLRAQQDADRDTEADYAVNVSWITPPLHADKP
jgi:hypothetical protein